MTPEVMNSPPIFSVANPLRISPRPTSNTPRRAVILDPNFLITLALRTARNDIQAVVSDPTNDSVEETTVPVRQEQPVSLPSNRMCRQTTK